MNYLLYLKASFRRKASRHISIFIIIICALVLPLLFVIYLDSSEYGQSVKLITMSRGEAIHIDNAQESDLDIFRGIVGMSEPWYEDGTIYLHPMDEEEWKSEQTLAHYGYLVMQRMEETNANYLRPHCFPYNYAHGISDDPLELLAHKVISGLAVFILVLAMFIIRSAYTSHLRKFQSDIGVLQSCGANDRQIAGIFLTEFVIIYPLAALCAVLLSAGVTKLVFALYMDVTETIWKSWIIFKFDILKILFWILAFGILLLFMIHKVLRKEAKMSLRGMMQADNLSAEMHKKRRQMKIMKKPERFLAALWKQRTNKAYRESLLVTISVMTLFVFLLGYLTADMYYLKDSGEYQLNITKDVIAAGGFTQDEINYLEAMENVERIECRQERLADEYAQAENMLYVDRIKIRLKEFDEHSKTKESLASHFSERIYVIDDYQEAADLGYQMTKGIYWLLLFMFSALFLFVMIVVYTKITDYLEDSKETIGICTSLGATEKVLKGSYLRQAGRAAVVGALLPIVLGIAGTVYVLVLSGEKYIFDVPFVLICVGSVTLVILGYIVPVKRKLEKMMRRDTYVD